MSAEFQLRWSDAWLLLAVHYATDRVLNCLAAIIAAADYINHAVMNYEELASGLARLERAELIRVSPAFKDVTCSANALATIQQIGGSVRTVHEARKELERRIQAAPWVPGEPVPHPANHLEYPGLSRKLYQEAVDAYLTSLKRRR